MKKVTATVAIACMGLLPGVSQAQSFQCPAAGTVVRTDDGTTMNWMGTLPGNPDICVVKGKDIANIYWAFALIPSDNETQAKSDVDSLKSSFPLKPKQPLILNYQRMHDGAPRQFRLTAVVQDEPPVVIGGLSHNVFSVTGNQPGGMTGPTPTASAGNRHFRVLFDRMTNVPLEVDTDPVSGLSSAAVHWKAVSVQMPVG